MSTQPKQDLVPFDPNEGMSEKGTGFRLPSADGIERGYLSITNAETYAAAFAKTLEGSDPFGISEFIGKALNVPPQMLSFGRMSFMPDSFNGGVLQWPGIAPEAIGKIVRENLAPQLIIGMRVDDVISYSQLSTHAWRPGWTIEPIAKSDTISTADKKDIQSAQSFLLNSNLETGNGSIRERDALKLTDFQGFLSAIVRDTLSYDQIAIWTVMSNDNKVKEYCSLPASQIRLTGPDGYEGNKDVFAVGLAEGNVVKYRFTRDQLVFYRRNIRGIGESLGYGYSEVEMGVRLIQGFQNALDLNIDTFNRSAIPNGILVMSGETVTQKQLDLMNRMFTNLKKGITKAWALPVIGMSGKDSKIEMLNLMDIKGMEVFYQDFMNMVVGAFCTVYRFPVQRLGYRISGKGKDTEMAPEAGGRITDRDDPGLAPLLIHLENVINEYLIWSNWPSLRFRFTGKNPKEDAREFENVTLARTLKEEREDAGLPDLESLAEGEEMKEAAKWLNLTPSDPAKSGIWQTLITTFLGGGEGEGGAEGQPGGAMGRKKDPVKSESKGGNAGIRRNSRREKGK